MFSGSNNSRLFFIWTIVIAVCLYGCLDNGFGRIWNISLSENADRNALRVYVQFNCSKSENAYVEYWMNGGNDKMFATPVSTQKSEFKLALTNLKFNSKYQYRIVLVKGGIKVRSDVYSFTTHDMPDWLLGFYRVNTENNQALPAGFKTGCMLVYHRIIPGFIGLLDYKGNLRWYQTFKNAGVKVAHFTQNKTILAILAPMDYPASYGNEILELSLTGDTVFCLKKGEKDFKQTIHHEILLNAKNQYVTLSEDERVVDLSALGGKKIDTIKGDGILVLDKWGKKVWSWSVFDELDPLKEKNIVREAGDWMHANSLFIDSDGNYIISFFNDGQIWKLNAATKKVMWKFGRGGDFKLPGYAAFDRGHAVHMNDRNELMLFDNGASKNRSQVLAFDLNEATKQASVRLQVPLQPGCFTDRMGSAYMIGDSTVLTCVSKQNLVLLTNLNGDILWRMRCANTPYRVEFIPYEKLGPYIGE